MMTKETRLGPILKKVAIKGFRVVIGAISLVSLVVPRRKGLIVFSQSRNRYSGNSRALFEYAAARTKDVFWLYDFQEISAPIHVGIETHFVKKYSVKGLWLCLKANTVVISHGSGDFGMWWPFARQARVLMLWHAIGIKCAGLVDNKFSPSIVRKLFNETRHYDLLLASSEIDRYYTASYQGVDVRKVHITGTPRTDRYLSRREIHVKDRSIERLSLLYAPTFRDWALTESLFFPFFDFNTDKLADLFYAYPCLIISLRPHPNDTKSIQDAIYLAESFPENIKLLTSEVVDDIDDVLYQFDAIITDYSSIYIEPLLADVPPIFVNVDMAQYLENRGIAYNYELVTPGPKVKTFGELVVAIEDAKQGAPAWQQHREFVRKMFFKYRDKNASARVYALISPLAEKRV